MKETNYNELISDIKALVEGVPHSISNFANAAAAIWLAMDEINWAGFYFTEGDKLILGPFQGKPACVIIPLGSGVCGTAAESERSLIVDDVHDFPGHIACDAASRSEIVIPMVKDDKLIGVLDIDSPIFDRFSEDDRKNLERLVEIIIQNI